VQNLVQKNPAASDKQPNDFNLSIPGAEQKERLKE
jgi:hypothetical protein